MLFFNEDNKQQKLKDINTAYFPKNYMTQIYKKWNEFK